MIPRDPAHSSSIRPYITASTYIHAFIFYIFGLRWSLFLPYLPLVFSTRGLGACFSFRAILKPKTTPAVHRRQHRPASLSERHLHCLPPGARPTSPPHPKGPSRCSRSVSKPERKSSSIHLLRLTPPPRRFTVPGSVPVAILQLCTTRRAWRYPSAKSQRPLSTSKPSSRWWF